MKLNPKNINNINEILNNMIDLVNKKTKQDKSIKKCINKLVNFVELLNNSIYNKTTKSDKMIKIKYKKIKNIVKNIKKTNKKLFNILEILAKQYPDEKEFYKTLQQNVIDISLAYIPKLEPVNIKTIKNEIEELSDEIVELLEIVKEKKDFEILDIAMDKISIFYSLSYDLERL